MNVISTITDQIFSPSSHITISALRNENPGISSAFVIGWLWAKSVDSRFIFSEDCLKRALREQPRRIG